jgi:hypothetical protein
MVDFLLHQHGRENDVALLDEQSYQFVLELFLQAFVRTGLQPGLDLFLQVIYVFTAGIFSKIVIDLRQALFLTSDFDGKEYCFAISFIL